MDWTDIPDDYSIEKRGNPVSNEDLPSVTFTDEEMADLRRVAEIRTNAQQHATDDLSDWDSRTEGKFNVDRHESMVDSDLIGIMGEEAFSKYYGLPEPFTSKERLPEGDGGYDFAVTIESNDSDLIAQNVKVDVKTTDRPQNGGFMHPRQRDLAATIYFLCPVDLDSNEVYLRGFVPRVMMEDAGVTYHKHGRKLANPAYSVPRSEAILPPEPENISPV